jgi:hypothetical protein
MPAKASQEEQILPYRLDPNFPNEPDKLAEREFKSVTIVPDHRCRGAVTLGGADGRQP